MTMNTPQISKRIISMKRQPSNSSNSPSNAPTVTFVPNINDVLASRKKHQQQILQLQPQQNTQHVLYRHPTTGNLFMTVKQNPTSFSSTPPQFFPQQNIIHSFSNSASNNNNTSSHPVLIQFPNNNYEAQNTFIGKPRPINFLEINRNYFVRCTKFALL